MESPEYLVALPFSPLEIGPYTGKSSLHCTLMHWFTLPATLTEAALKEELRRICFDLCAENIELVSMETALFGPNGDVPVSVLEKNKILDRYHHRLLEYLRSKQCGLPREDWIGFKYRAHVTASNDKVFAIGQRHKVSRLVLLKRTAAGEKSVILQMLW